MQKVFTLIPAKSFRQAKQRLATVLDAPQREALSARMLAHTLRTVRAVVDDQPIWIVTTDLEVAQFALRNGADISHSAAFTDLNGELRDAAKLVSPGAALMVIHADLPTLEPSDVRALLSTMAQLTIAPDHIGTGTTALLQRQPDRFFAFGPDSFERHCATARQRSLSIAQIKRPGLASDLDSPDDLSRLGQLVGQISLVRKASSECQCPG